MIFFLNHSLLLFYARNCFLALNEFNLWSNSTGMLQRVQSLLLLGVALISLILIYIPIYEEVPLTTGEVETVPIPIGISRSAILLLINAATGILAFFAIFLYKRRNIQVRVSNLTILLTSIFIALLFFMVDATSADSHRIKYLTGAYLPFIQVLLSFLATWFIKKDDELVKSADRLR